MYSEEQIKALFCKEFKQDIDFNDKFYLDIAYIITRYTHIVLHMQQEIKSSILNRAYYVMQQIPEVKENIKDYLVRWNNFT